MPPQNENIPNQEPQTNTPPQPTNQTPQTVNAPQVQDAVGKK